MNMPQRASRDMPHCMHVGITVCIGMSDMVSQESSASLLQITASMPQTARMHACLCTGTCSTQPSTTIIIRDIVMVLCFVEGVAAIRRNVQICVAVANSHHSLHSRIQHVRKSTHMHSYAGMQLMICNMQACRYAYL
jgi:hypothetical protein